ncbi:MAG TPA: hypothetical protein VKB27_12065 [Gammaproteobacteria bacterium]|nr:hypothetical protein [Gammaproteobacteria bacterium]
MTGGQSPNGFRWRGIAKLFVLVALLVVLNIFARDAIDVIDVLDFKIRPSNEDAVHRTIMASAALYVLLLAIPFVPSAEIGIALMAMLGPPIAILVYLCTLAGLSLSFTAGRLIPLTILVRLTRDFKLHKTGRLLEAIEPLNRKQRLDLLLTISSRRYLPWLLRYRYLALAVALNIPGNYVIGGGGGIALIAGVSRVYSIPGFLLTILLAVAPVPLAVVVFGTGFLAG